MKNGTYTFLYFAFYEIIDVLQPYYNLQNNTTGRARQVIKKTLNILDKRIDCKKIFKKEPKVLI